jgi:hypothetical protein
MVLDISNLFMSFIKSLYLIYFVSLNRNPEEVTHKNDNACRGTRKKNRQTSRKYK